jgi:6-phosphogluconolactonase/glucosamine-6-phosphate isomerase/deaminase
MPECTITMGIRTILEAKKILLLATETKAETVAGVESDYGVGDNCVTASSD